MTVRIAILPDGYAVKAPNGDWIHADLITANPDIPESDWEEADYGVVDDDTGYYYDLYHGR